MSKKYLNEIRRFRKLAGTLKEMRVGPDGSLMSDEEAVDRAIEGHTSSLAKILKALNKDPQYARARQALDTWITTVAEKLSVDPDSVPKNHNAFSGEHSYGEALPMIKQIFIDLISGDQEEELMEDDYTEDPSTIPSGGTDVMDIAEGDDLDLSNIPRFDMIPRDFKEDPEFFQWLIEKYESYDFHEVVESMLYCMKDEIAREMYKDFLEDQGD